MGFGGAVLILRPRAPTKGLRKPPCWCPPPKILSIGKNYTIESKWLTATEI
jgi:hypothetical protein